MAKISIIVPVYNVEQYLDQCISSLINQTLHDIEIICIDDCSTDNSYNILKKYAKQDNRISLLQTKKNSGLATTRNLGLKQAHAKYIMFCDSDDWFAPTMCEEMFRLITKTNAELGICSVNVIYEDNQNMKSQDKHFLLPDGLFAPTDKTIQNAHNGAPLRIIRHDIIKKHNLEFPNGLAYEDACFSKIYYLYTTKIATTSKKLYNYRRRKNSIMNKIYTGESKTARNFFDIAVYYFNYLKVNNIYKREYLDFWTNTFINWTRNALMFTQNVHNKDILMQDIKKFISENYIFGTTNEYADYIMYLMLSNRFMQRKKYILGIYEVFNNGQKTEYSLCKISLFKIKRTENKIKYYVFGICVYQKDKK